MSLQFPHFPTLKSLYYEFIIPLQQKYREIELRGIKVDFEQRKKLDNKYSELLKISHDKLNTLAGREINYNSNVKQIPNLIYGDLGCPRRKGVDDNTLQALKSNVLKKSSKWNRAVETIDLVIECRKLHKCLNTYVRARPDPDGRMRTLYSLTKETGRTSTSILKSPVRWGKYGMAFQTITKHAEWSGIGTDIRSMFIPDEGKMFVEVDGSQAEARVVMLLSEEYELLEKMDDPKFDLHVLTSSWLYPKIFLPMLIDKEKGYFSKEAKKHIMRQRGKKTRHAANYDMGVGECSLQMRVSQAIAKTCLETFHKFSPKIKGVFHKDIQECLGRNRVLWTPIGRRREFFEKWSNKLFKEAYANIPQGTISDLTKWSLLESSRAGVNDILMESHDSFTYQIEEDKLDWSLVIVKSLMESEIDFSTCSLPRGKIRIPSEIKLYRKNLQEGEDYKIKEVINV